MAPPRPPPELADDAVREVLLHLPPEDPACLVRAALVCKPWRRILSDAGFLRRYRRFHRAPPLLGFFHDVCRYDATPRFVPTMAAASPPLRTALDRGSWAFDCRHGRVLLQPMGLDGGGGGFVVWDPITGDQVELREPDVSCHHFAASVLCSRDGCDHLHCAGGPFTVVFVGSMSGIQRACFYSSEAGAWSAPASLRVSPYSAVEPNRGALVGDKIYFTLMPGKEILQYDLGKHCLSVMVPPGAYRKNGVLMGSEIGSLGLAGINGGNLYLWSKKVEPEEVAGWVQWMVINLQTLVPTYDPYCSQARVIGFAEAVRAIFIRTNACLFLLELKSGKMRKVRKGVDYDAVLPFTGFYPPGSANRKLLLPLETN